MYKKTSEGDKFYFLTLHLFRLYDIERFEQISYSFANMILNLIKTTPHMNIFAL